MSPIILSAPLGRGDNIQYHYLLSLEHFLLYRKLVFICRDNQQSTPVPKKVDVDVDVMMSGPGSVFARP